jgi:tetratricopeptide (TPR) repeat protein
VKPEPMKTMTRFAANSRRAIVCVAALVLLQVVPGAPSSQAQSRTESELPRATRMAEARRLSDAGQFDSAASVLRGILADDPGARDARSLLARVLAWNRRYDESIVEYQRLLADDPDDALDRAGYARVLAWSGRPEKSFVEFRRAIAADSTNLETRVSYARALSWAGDLPGAAMEYRRILRANPDYGDAWLGYATVVRWRGAATASDRFLSLAESLRADPKAAADERAAVQQALAPAVGGGWSTSRERQYLEGPDYTTETTGPFAYGRATVARTVDVTLRAAWLEQFERTESGALNYDLDMFVLRAGVAILRGYPFQVTAGVESRTLENHTGDELYPLLDDDFFGWNARATWFIGRLTADAGIHRDFLPIKSTSGPNEVFPGNQTTLESRLDWQWNGRGHVYAGVEHGDFSDENNRRTVRGGTSYRVHAGNPSATLDYGIAFTDYDTTSRSYFTPLESVRHAAGVALAGYSERAQADYGARYQFSYLTSENFDDIRANTLSAYLNAVAFRSLRLGVEGSYSRDNNAYEAWTAVLSASVKW